MDECSSRAVKQGMWCKGGAHNYFIQYVASLTVMCANLVCHDWSHVCSAGWCPEMLLLTMSKTCRALRVRIVVLSLRWGLGST